MSFQVEPYFEFVKMPARLGFHHAIAAFEEGLQATRGAGQEQCRQMRRLRLPVIGDDLSMTDMIQPWNVVIQLIQPTKIGIYS